MTNCFSIIHLLVTQTLLDFPCLNTNSLPTWFNCEFKIDSRSQNSWRVRHDSLESQNVVLHPAGGLPPHTHHCARDDDDGVSSEAQELKFERLQEANRRHSRRPQPQSSKNVDGKDAERGREETTVNRPRADHESPDYVPWWTHEWTRRSHRVGLHSTAETAGARGQNDHLHDPPAVGGHVWSVWQYLFARAGSVRLLWLTESIDTLSTQPQLHLP